MTDTFEDRTAIKLRLALSRAGQRRIEKHPTFQSPDAGPIVPSREVTTYFDTQDNLLERHGLSLCIREMGDRYIQEIQRTSAGKVAEHGQKRQWPLDHKEPDLGLAMDWLLAMGLPLPTRALQPIVTTDLHCLSRKLRIGASTVEAVLDLGIVAAGGTRRTIRELELRSMAGSTAALYRIALDLHATEPVKMAYESGFAQGNRLRTGGAAQPRKATDPHLDGKATGADAFSQIIYGSLQHLLANQSAALCEDIEAIHQMRVAVRRLRAALLLFARHLEPHALDRVQTELRRIGRVFGEARDWDVFCGEILPNTADAAEAADWIELLRESALGRRAAAHQVFLREANAPAFTALIFGLWGWAAAARQTPGLVGDELDRPMSYLAPHMLDRLAHKVDRRGHHLGELSGPQLHGLRKSLKKLRYAVEFTASLYPHKAVKAYLRGCKNLQESLGTINDAATACSLAQSLTEARVDLTPGLAALARYSERRRSEAMHGLADQWSSFQKQKRFWS